MSKGNIGSSFDDFLEEEGLLEQAEVVAIKRVLAFQLTQLMEEKRLSKAALARQLGTSRAALDRLLDPENASVTLLTLERVARTLGKRLRVDFVDRRDAA